MLIICSTFVALCKCPIVYKFGKGYVALKGVISNQLSRDLAHVLIYE
jgi:hypothetical protein